MIKECLGINVFIDDKPPKNYKEKKYEKIFIFVGKRTEKNLSYEKWKEIIVELARIKPCVVADDHEQKIMEKLKEDGDIKNNDNIELIVGKRSLEELAEIANNSKLFIAVDGGGEHYLERYTNSITIYTCGLPLQWKPYSLNSYEKFKLKDEHVMEKTINSKGLKKYIIYRIEKRRPCLGLCCDYEEFKNIDVSIIVDVVKEILVA
jgi:ADP-heptose:LPS heptosyltransferase